MNIYSKSLLYGLGGILVVGGIGLILGFFIPLAASESFQGPLLGIFCTGPLGSLAGFIIGVWIAIVGKIKIWRRKAVDAERGTLLIVDGEGVLWQAESGPAGFVRASRRAVVRVIDLPSG